MPDYAPTIVTSADPLVEVITPDATSYEAVQASMGTYIYELINIYQRASTSSQINQNILFKKYDKFGNRQLQLMPMNIDPYQSQSSYNSDMKKMKYKFDSNNNMFMTIEAGAIVNMTIDVIELKVEEYLPGKDNFSDIDLLNDYKTDF